jgi:hypothetical protein
MFEVKSDKQKLVDLCFAIGIMLSTPGKGRDDKKYDMTKWSVPKKAEWIAEQLRLSGFDTLPVGSSWGVLK